MERKGHRSTCRYDGEVCDWSRTSSDSTRRSKRQSSQGSSVSTQGKLQRDEWLTPQHVEQASLRHIESASEIEWTPSSPSLQERAGMEQTWDAKPRMIPLEWVWESQSVSELDSVAASPSLQEDADTDYVRKKEPVRIPLECSCEFHSIGESQSLPSCTSNRKPGGTMDIFREEPLRIPLEMTHVVRIPQLEDPRYLEKQTLQEDYSLENRSPLLAREPVKSRKDYNPSTCNERSKIQRRWHITATSTSCALQDPRESQGRYATIGNRSTRVATDSPSASQRNTSVEECSGGVPRACIEYSTPSSSMAGLSPLEYSPALFDVHEERRRPQEAYVSGSTERTVAPVDTHVMSWRLHLAEGIIRTSVSDSTMSIGPADGPLEYPHALGMRIKNGMVRTLRQRSKESEELGTQMKQLKLRAGERCRLDRLAIKEMREFIQELREKRSKM